MRRDAPDGKPFGEDRFIFGNEVGEQIGSIKKAWQTAILKAHGHTPQWVKDKNNQLAPSRLQPTVRSTSTFTTFGGSSAVACSNPARRSIAGATCSGTRTSVRRAPTCNRPPKALAMPSSARKSTSAKCRKHVDVSPANFPTRMQHVTIGPNGFRTSKPQDRPH